MTTRCIVVADPGALAARVLVPALIREIREHPDCCCAGLVLTGCASAWEGLRAFWGRLGVRCLQVAMGTGRWEGSLSIRPLAVRSLVRDGAVPLLLAPGGDPNHSEVLHRLRNDLQAEAALNVYCTKRFKEPLLSSFEVCVNYHNGLLPRLRGLRASNWSIYMEEQTSGYTFHRMDPGMDTGDILADGVVPVLTRDTPGELELRKAMAARSLLPRVLDAMIRRDKGQPQRGIGGHHDRQALLLATRVEDPSALTRAEWSRRLRAFLSIDTMIAGRWVPVTGLEPARGPGRLAFRTADGLWLRASSIQFWPAWRVFPYSGRRWS